MTVSLSTEERDLLDGQRGSGVALAMRILVETARILGAESLVRVASAHIDACLYHGDSGVLFVERLLDEGAAVSVPTTLNVGGIDLVHPQRVRHDTHSRAMAQRMMSAYVALGCRATWTCAPYQAGHRPRRGDDVAWGESNAVVFCNSVLGARTNRYGDFLDVCAAITGRAPYVGLHVPDNRIASILIDASRVPRSWLADESTFAVIGAWLGHTFGGAIAAFEWLGLPDEDQLKALGAAAASSGSIALFHIIGVTPEAPTRAVAFAGRPPREVVLLTTDMLREARARLSTVTVEAGMPIDAVALGSPHLSIAQVRTLAGLLAGQQCRVPLYLCTGRHTLAAAKSEGLIESLEGCGAVFVVDTCIVVAPILPEGRGTLVTNSGKFAHYTRPNTGYDVVFATLEDCVRSAVAGSLADADILLSSGRQHGTA